MDISPDEFSQLCSYFIEISLLYETYPSKYHGYYLLFIDKIVDQYTYYIRLQIYEAQKRFRTKYNLQCPNEMSIQLENIIYSIMLL